MKYVYLSILIAAAALVPSPAEAACKYCDKSNPFMAKCAAAGAGQSGGEDCMAAGSTCTIGAPACTGGGGATNCDVPGHRTCIAIENQYGQIDESGDGQCVPDVLDPAPTPLEPDAEAAPSPLQSPSAPPLSHFFDLTRA